MKKVLSITATILVIAAATFLVYQFMFLQKPEQVLADIGKEIGAIKSGKAEFTLTLDVDGVRLVEESGTAAWTGKLTAISKFIDAKSYEAQAAQETARFDVTFKTPQSRREVNKVQLGDTVYLKGPDTGEKWIVYKQGEIIEAAEDIPGWGYINAMLVATDYLQEYERAVGLETVDYEGRKQRHMQLPLKKDEWLKAVAAQGEKPVPGGLENAHVATQLWVDYKSSLPTKTEVRFFLNSTQKVSCVFTVSYSGFNEPQNITAPPAEQVMTRAEFDKHMAFARDLTRAATYVDQEKYSQALGILSRLEGQKPEHVRVLELMAVSYSGLRKKTDAEVYVAKVLSVNPNSSDGYRVKSDLNMREIHDMKHAYIARRRDEIAAEIAKKGYSEVAPGVVYDSVVDLSEEECDALTSILGGQFEEKHKEQFKDELIEALRSAIKATSLNPLSAEAYVSLGFAYIQQENLVGALRAFEKAVTLKPGLRSANVILATYRGGSGNKDRAMRVLKKYYPADVPVEVQDAAENILSEMKKADIPPMQEDILQDMARTSSVERLNKVQAEKKKPVFMFFYAPKCAVSLELADELKALKGTYGEDIEFFVFDIDGGSIGVSELTERFAVSITPTMLVIDKDGTTLHKHDGYIDDEILEQWIDNGIPKP